ncbi:MAG: exodeoxyribonuclease III [Erysipelotrichaceae bacterium]|nr:exodeoxyribonuclease III [Erysipelotrichaceae bacterium]
MRFVSWNVNGLRACVTKGFEDFFKDMDADFFCIQETKMQPHQLQLDLPGYHQYFYSAQRKGYSGTAIFAKQEPLSVSYDFNDDKHNDEGRVITLEYDNFYLVNAYVPNSKEGLLRLDYRQEWEDWLRSNLVRLSEHKSVIYCGDLNVAHNEIDLKNPDRNHKNAGFSDEERAKFTELLASGFIDTFRYLYPDKVEYSWWSYRFNSRSKNIGWRIDYFVISKDLKDKLKDAKIHSNILGSDHCPVSLEIEL